VNAAEGATRILEALRAGDSVAEVVALDGPSAGQRLIVSSERAAGTLGGAELDKRAVTIARAALGAGRAATHEIEVGGSAFRVYVEPHRPPGELVIVGAGHIARPLARMGAMLGFRVVVLDDRPGFATPERFPDADLLLNADFTDPFRDAPLSERSHLVLVTRGHLHDFEILRRVMLGGAEPAYIGMVGSQRRVRAALEQLAREGISPARLRSIHAPVGLDIGAETPEEIAVAIAAELVLVRRGGAGTPLRDSARVVERWIERLD
jgi:xanthine dehydrogenase accessory factor